MHLQSHEKTWGRRQTRKRWRGKEKIQTQTCRDQHPTFTVLQIQTYLSRRKKRPVLTRLFQIVGENYAQQKEQKPILFSCRYALSEFTFFVVEIRFFDAVLTRVSCKITEQTVTWKQHRQNDEEQESSRGAMCQNLVLGLGVMDFMRGKSAKKQTLQLRYCPPFLLNQSLKLQSISKECPSVYSAGK